ncbi:hypothetical protein [Escherichia coli]
MSLDRVEGARWSFMKQQPEGASAGLPGCCCRVM